MPAVLAASNFSFYMNQRNHSGLLGLPGGVREVAAEGRFVDPIAISLCWGVHTMSATPMRQQWHISR